MTTALHYFSATIVVSVMSVAVAQVVGPTPTDTNGNVPTTPWGEPDLQGIWTRDADIPLQRPARFKDKEFFTDEERAELDRRISDIVARDGTEARRERGTERDVSREANLPVWSTHLRVGRRTSLIVDPPDGRIPPLTPQAQMAASELRQFQVALLQATVACKEKRAGCAGGAYGPVSPRRNETPPQYMFIALNRADNPEDRSMSARCLGTWIPNFGNVWGSAYRIVQTPGRMALSYDLAFGLGFYRLIPVNAAPHLPSSVRQWWGDSRGRWEGNTLVVDVTNFSPKSDYQGSHDNLHLIERWTRLDSDTLEYAVTVDDPTRWTKPWTVKQQLKKQSDEANRIFDEPRCHEGNYGLPAMLRGARAADKEFAEGVGPDPATWCITQVCGGGASGFADDGEDADPLQ